MAKQTMRVKITGGHNGQTGVVLGPGRFAKPGDVVELDNWTANHLINAKGRDSDGPGLAVPFEGRGGK